ncbi:MAG: hypothetical protein ACKVOQ_03965 [Cyclobacteriaceae bacterium]
MSKFFLVLLASLVFLSVTFSQNPLKDTAQISAIESAKEIYTQTMKGQGQFYNGGDYIDYQQIEDEHPYFLSNNWIVGSIHYDGEIYENVGLLYNTLTDNVIVEYYHSSTMIQLVKEKLLYFTVYGQTFFNIQNNALQSGFYERLCNGKVKVFAKRFKVFQKKTSFANQQSFEEKSKYYIFKNGIYHAVKSKNSVLSVTGDQKKEVKQFLNKNGLQFGKSREMSIIKAVEFYNNLIEK